MTKFNPDFWEMTIASESWRSFSEEDALWYERPEEAALRQTRASRAREVWPQLQNVIDEVLTIRQREVVLLYYVDGLNQRQIAERLGVSQQAVSEHLYGKIRKGHSVGGAIRKLRKELSARGLSVDWLSP